MPAEEFIMESFAIRRSGKGYKLLCLAIREACQLYPDYPTFDALCRILLDSVQETSVSAIRRALARAVDTLWEIKDNRPLFDRFYGYPVRDKPSAKDFVYTMSDYIHHQHETNIRIVPLNFLLGKIKPLLGSMPDGRPCLAIPLDDLAQLSEILKEGMKVI